MPPKAAAAPKPKSAAPEHASYQAMITDAIVNLKDRKGSRYDHIHIYREPHLSSKPDASFLFVFKLTLDTAVRRSSSTFAPTTTSLPPITCSMLASTAP